MTQQREKLYSNIWHEEANERDPFVADKCYLAGYDVYGDLLGKVNWIDYLYVLFRQNPPEKNVSACFNNLAIALACRGPRDVATQAATSAAAGGSTLASCLMAALAVGAGQSGGAREVFYSAQLWSEFGSDSKQWQNYFENRAWVKPQDSVWPGSEHPWGFDPLGVCCSLPLIQTLDRLSSDKQFTLLAWFKENRSYLEELAGLPISMTGIAACAFIDLGFDPQQAEMLFLLLSLPGIAALSMEQHWNGWAKYPFHKDGLKLLNDPSTRTEI